MDGLHLGVASQSPPVRLLRPVDDLGLEAAAPIVLDTLQRGRDYSFTTGGVARMVSGLLQRLGRRYGLRGEWVTLGAGAPMTYEHHGVLLRPAQLPAWALRPYGRFKEVLWEVLNGLPPRLEDPARLAGEDGDLVAAYEAWSEANTATLLQAERSRSFDVFYVNDWQQLPQGRTLAPRPRLMHFHAPVATWTPEPWREFVQAHLEHFDAVVVSTRATAAALRSAGFPRPVFQVYPWLDPSAFPEVRPGEVQAFEAAHGIAADDAVILNVARMDPIKGQDRLLHAFKAVLRRRPEARLVLVGNGSFSSSRKGGIGLGKGAKWRAKLEALAKDLGVAERVVFTGHVPQATLPAAVTRADAVAFPSVAEGFGLTVAEAWLYGKAVVVSPGAGIAELVRPGENGDVADAADPAGYAEALLRALEAPPGVGEAGRATALHSCDVERNAGRVVGLLQELAAGARLRAR